MMMKAASNDYGTEVVRRERKWQRQKPKQKNSRKSRLEWEEGEGGAEMYRRKERFEKVKSESDMELE